MVCYDGYLLSHTYMPFEVPEQEKVARFLTPFKPSYALDPSNPANLNTVTLPDMRMDVTGEMAHGYMEIRYLLQEDLRKRPDRSPRRPTTRSRRSSGGAETPLVEPYRCDDAEYIVVGLGSLTYQLRDVVETLRDEGHKIGVLGVRLYRPFPDEAVAAALQGARGVFVIEKALSYGYEGALCSDLKSALYDHIPDKSRAPFVKGLIAGIGGREIRTADLTDTLRAGIAGTHPGTQLDRDPALGASMTTKTTILTLPKEEYVHPGNRACTGCGLSIAYRIGLKALGPDTILVVPPSCLTVLQGLFPVASTKLPCLNVTFASTAAAATGVLEALKAQGREHIKVVAWAGDGGTADIGIQALSGAAERGDDFLFMCYDNEGYMNTGVQRSGTTPQGAITANTPFKGKHAAEEGRAGHHGRPRHRLRGHGFGRLPARPLRQDQEGHLPQGHQVHPHPHALPARLGLRPALHRQDRRAGRGDRLLGPLRGGEGRVPAHRRVGQDAEEGRPGSR